MEKPLVIIGAIEPVIRTALTSAWANRIEVCDSDARGAKLANEARARHARAVIVPPEEVEEVCGGASPGVLVLGLSVGNFAVVVCGDDDVTSMPNPSPDSIAALIRNTS